ncbi:MULTISPECIES: contractile injection system tape measure protein [Parabacteroides]|jgi:hypothetical protein|uniref:contractile injection system tape measure protein n=1 Tax=Parabacteroides TaxID=375288 RepID=UPI001EED067B|nr:contractile injection system tape measure protein [Parabacteroides sp. AF18-52]DAW68814.1 MAG TPA: hypothetical protein [Caudoviricetes sp.]
MIAIGKVTFDFNMEDESYARQLYGRWDTFSRTSFEQVVDDVLSRFDSSDETIEIESLSLDLGVIPEDEFDDKFPKILAEKLNETFSDFLRNPESHSQQIRIIPVSKSRIELLACYLQYGFFPWLANTENLNLETLLLEAMQMDNDALRQLIHTLGDNEKVRTRLIWQLSDKMLESIVVLIEPGESGFINTYTHVLVALYPYTGHPEISRLNFRDVVHNLVFAYLLYPNRGYFMRKQFVWQTIYGLAQRYNIQVLSLIDILTSQVQTLSEGKTLLPGLFLILNELRTEMKLDGGPHLDIKNGDINTINTNKQTVQGTVSDSHKDDALSTSTNNQLINNLKNTEMENFNEKTFEVQNAGLVLISPYLPILFYRLGYLAEDRRSFVNKEKQIRAIFLLQYMTSEKPDYNEASLLLNRVLVNYPISEPLPRNVELTQAETDMADQMLTAIKTNWDKMRNTSVRGFQDAFLKRKGKLEESEDRWMLKVEERAYDILLDSVPWSFKMFRYPFQEKTMLVEWR